jgi:hypothetical protein
VNDCVKTEDLVILDFSTCPPTKTVIPNQVDSEEYDSGPIHEAIRQHPTYSDWLHSNAAGITHDGYYYVNFRWVNTINVYDNVYPYKKLYSISGWSDKVSDYKFINDQDKWY